MLKALLKKQFLELNAFYFQNRKTGKQRSRAGAIGMIVLYVVLMLFVAGFMFTIAMLMADGLVSAGFGWLYFGLMGLIACILGVFGSVFNTYASLYHAKDNELLLSMPIPPRKILLVRMVGVFAMSLLYEAIVFVPAIVAYVLCAKVTIAAMVDCVLLVLVLGIFVLTMSCIFGWVVALIAGKLKNKSILTVLISLVFLAVYYFFCMNYYSMIQNLIANAALYGESLRSAYPIYLLGKAAEGCIGAMAVFTAGVAVLFVIVYAILSKSFLKIATQNRGSAKVVYRERAAKRGSVESALFRKEWKRFASSATYMLNGGIGILFLLAAAVASLIFRGRINSVLELIALPKDFIAIMVPAAVSLIASMTAITAPSVSLEGKNLWILQSMPLAAKKVLQAKQKLQLSMTVPASVIAAVCVGIALDVQVFGIAAAVVFSVAFALLFSAIGLALNLKHPNLNWTNEAVPIKQGMPVSIALFGGWVLAAAYAAGGWFAGKVMPGEVYILLVSAALLVFTRLLNRWLDTTGARIFAEL